MTRSPQKPPLPLGEGVFVDDQFFNDDATVGVRYEMRRWVRYDDAMVGVRYDDAIVV